MAVHVDGRRGAGRWLVNQDGGGLPVRVHGAFVGDDEVPYKLEPGSVPHELAAALPAILEYFLELDEGLPGGGDDPLGRLAGVDVEVVDVEVVDVEVVDVVVGGINVPVVNVPFG